jgi:hypothetical protein
MLGWEIFFRYHKLCLALENLDFLRVACTSKNWSSTLLLLELSLINIERKNQTVITQLLRNKAQKATNHLYSVGVLRRTNNKLENKKRMTFVSKRNNSKE